MRLGCMKAGAMGIRDHPFFSGFDWKGLAERNLLHAIACVAHAPQNSIKEPGVAAVCLLAYITDFWCDYQG